MGYYSAIRKDEILLPFLTTWMDLENIMFSKISQMGKVKNHMISLICIYIKLKPTNKQANKNP